MCSYRVRRFWQTRKIFLWFFLLTAEGIVKTEMKRLRQCQFSQTQSLIYISILSGRWRKILLSWDSNVFKIPFWGFRNVHYSLLAELLMFSLNDSERGSLNSDVVNDAPTLHFNPGPLQYYTGNDSQDYLTSYWVQGSQKNLDLASFRIFNNCLSCSKWIHLTMKNSSTIPNISNKLI